jgi:hypothetical protein
MSGGVPQKPRSRRAETKSGWRGFLQPLDVYSRIWRARQDLKHPATARIPRHGREGISYPLVEARVGKLFGRADFLKRVERPSKLGSFSYEVQDTKLARSPKAKFVVGDGALTPSTPDSAARCAFMLAGMASPCEPCRGTR